ncbi:hypothetical protein [Bacillus sp. ISL-7]|uniref:hypothetical protein n=1 Tax=Bacillus sp. ISL-7 TaxID=2819136 RepID=UPI001BE62FB7|nr:hypothetical protein [Bacillus sp. ISL-7]MBT2734723.1 hypothetical protein [Bacillus sp. ISL-7]
MENRKSIEIGSIKLSFVEKVTYQSLNVDSFQEKFQELKDGSYIIADSFDSNTWKLTNKTSEELQTVVFDVGLYPEINNSLKCFVVMARHSGLSPQHTKRNQYLVKELAWITKGFTDIEIFESHLDEISRKAIFYDVMSAFQKFVDFYSFPQKEAFLEKVSLFNKKEYTVRDLPPFRDVFIFEDVMNHYSQMNSDEFLKLKYYPVELWWYLTNIIAMRPNEFLRIRMDCLDPKSDGTFWITIPRTKLKSRGPEQEFWEQPLQIDEKIYRFFREYIFQLEILGIESAFLFPQELYKLTHPRAKNDYERISNHQFDDLLKSFFIEIVN